MIDTRLTRMFGLTHPIVQAPMAGIAGGRLAAAVAQAGGLGLIGGSNCDSDWIDAEFRLAGNEAVGCGFWAWRLAQEPGLLDRVLARNPRAIWLSHGDPRPFSETIAEARVPLICQVQSVEDAWHAVEAGACVIAAQGIEAGGYGARRPMMSLLIELADFLHEKAHDTLLLAAGGIVDARGLAACLAAGADGAVLGTRLWASEEALVHPDEVRAVLNGSGEGRQEDPLEDRAAARQKAHLNASTESTFEAGPALGEAVRLVRSAQPVRYILETLSGRAERLMTTGARKVISLGPQPVTSGS